MAICIGAKAKESWLEVGRLPEEIRGSAHEIVNIYRKRMQIEENFRDPKSTWLGLGLEYARSKSPQRYDNLLLIAALVMFVL